MPATLTKSDKQPKENRTMQATQPRTKTRTKQLTKKQIAETEQAAILQLEDALFAMRQVRWWSVGECNRKVDEVILEHKQGLVEEVFFRNPDAVTDRVLLERDEEDTDENWQCRLDDEAAGLAMDMDAAECDELIDEYA